jgi:hypothetical protein
VQVGLLSGVLFGAFQYGQVGSVVGAAVGGTVFGVLYGATMGAMPALELRRSKDLAPADRLEVSRVVRRGTRVADARLAPAVIAYAGLVQAQQERNGRRWWQGLIFLGVILALAVGETMRSSVRSAAMDWLFVGVIIVVLVASPRLRGRIVDRAQRAARLARQAE